MLGGEWFEDLFGNPEKVNEESIKRIALVELKNQLGITKSPTRAISKIHKVRRKHTVFVILSTSSKTLAELLPFVPSWSFSETW